MSAEKNTIVGNTPKATERSKLKRGGQAPSAGSPLIPNRNEEPASAWEIVAWKSCPAQVNRARPGDVRRINRANANWSRSPPPITRHGIRRRSVLIAQATIIMSNRPRTLVSRSIQGDSLSSFRLSGCVVWGLADQELDEAGGSGCCQALIPPSI